jgi:2-methylisocitrate lyase-like PEP mutase family enzyme
VTDDDKAARFLALHAGPAPLLLPNPWDTGSARVLASLGFQALATTSSGFAASLGKLDGTITRGQALGHAATIVGATDLPVSADMENCFADDPSGVADTIALAARTGLAGCSIEDYTRDESRPIYELALAADRVAAAAATAHKGPNKLVLTARAENYLHGRDDLADTIARLQAYQAAGADVLFAPGLTTVEDIRAVVSSVDLPVNVLALPGGPDVAGLAELGVRRISVGGAFAYAAVAALAEAARGVIEQGTFTYWDQTAAGRAVAKTAFAD